jgi:hypothetical protein
MGIANDIPALAPDVEYMARSNRAAHESRWHPTADSASQHGAHVPVFIPINLPEELSRGPPEFPGLMAASD